MNRFCLSLAMMGLFLLLFVGCFSGLQTAKNAKMAIWMSTNGKVKVLCTTAMISDLVQEVGKEAIDCLTLIEGESDPHTYQLVKGDDEKFSRAEVIFYNGLGLEHGPSLAAALKVNPHAYALGDFVRSKHPSLIIKINESTDPHLWMDVSLWKETVVSIADVLSQVRPEYAQQFIENRDKVIAQLEKIHLEISQLIQSLPDSSRYLVTSHEAFNYFARAYLCPEAERKTDQWKVRVMAPEGLAPDSQLSTADIQRLVEHIITYRVSVVFAESNVSRDSLKKITDSCRKKGFRVHICERPLYADAMGPQGSPGGNYMGMMKHNAQVIYEELKPSMVSCTTLR